MEGNARDETHGTPMQDLEHGVTTVPSTRKSADAITTPVVATSSHDDAASHEPVNDESSSHDSHILEKFKDHVPPVLARRTRRITNWFRGPTPSKRWRIRPFLPSIQHFPLKVTDRLVKAEWAQWVVLGLFYIVWLICFGAVIHKSSTESVGPWGQPYDIACGGTFWESGNECGVNGTLCAPFSNSSFVFRCPSSCLSEDILNPRAVGPLEVDYRPFVIGGPTSDTDFLYRGDSFICGAAIHAGIISNNKGGCGVASLTGQGTNYPSVSRNGIDSIGFDSNFPQSFTFLNVPSSCVDLSWTLLAVNVVFTVLLSLFTRSAPIFFYSVFIAGYFQAALATDTPDYATINVLVSTALSNFLPAIFIIHVMYRTFLSRVLQGLTAQIERTVLFVGPFWVATLADYTFELIPIQRLDSQDLHQQPGGIASLVVIVVVLLVIFVGQIYAFRREGRLPNLVALYVVIGIGLGLLAAIPGETLRIHHYILALLLIPGTSVQTRPALVYSGILTGLFVNGVARWGLESIVQTAAELQGDAILGSALPAIRVAQATVSNITFSWGAVASGYNGTSVLVNDVERYRDNNPGGASWTWPRLVEGENEYFRFAFVSLTAADGMVPGDYTRAGTWWANGTWTQMVAGPS